MIHTRTQIINQLFNNYNFEKYLEIGVNDPSVNFNLINSKYKDSVDPGKYKDHVDPGFGWEYTFKMTSDEYFKISNDYYDVIFIDAFHEKKQLYKDIKNSINHLKTNGFIVMHDVNPTSEWETVSYETWLKRGKSWSGDCYKAFIEIKHEMEDWSCFIVVDCGILTKRPILKNIQINYKENIDWEYFSIHRNDLLQITGYNDYINLLK